MLIEREKAGSDFGIIGVYMSFDFRNTEYVYYDFFQFRNNLGN